MADELSALLAANPAAASSADWQGRMREAQEATAAAIIAWKGNRTVIDQALAKVAGERSARGGAVRGPERHTTAHGSSSCARPLARC